MSSPLESDTAFIPNSEPPAASIRSNGLGYLVEQKIQTSKVFPKAPVVDVFGRTEANPNMIQEVLNSHIQQAAPKLKAPGPWDFLPKGPFYIEKGRIVLFSSTLDATTRRGREAIMASIDPEHSKFSSAKRQTATDRALKNSRASGESSAPKQGIRPQQGGRR